MPDTAMVKRLAVLIAIVGCLTAIAANYLQIRSQPPAIILSPATRSSKAVPHSNDLHRCRQLGEAATSDPRCLRAWRESRDRFLNRQFR